MHRYLGFEPNAQRLAGRLFAIDKLGSDRVLSENPKVFDVADRPLILERLDLDTFVKARSQRVVQTWPLIATFYSPLAFTKIAQSTLVNVA